MVGPGFNPRWAKQNNWLVYSAYNPDKAKGGDRGVENMFHDADTGHTKVLVAHLGAVDLGETDADDRWIFGLQRDRSADPQYRTVRISLPDGSMEFLPEVSGIHLLPNPRHPVFFTRHEPNTDPFAATRAFYDLDGNNERIGVLTRRHDLNATGKATRRINYNNGLIATREYYKPDGHLVSREVFDKSGSVIEHSRFLPDSKGGPGNILRETWHYDGGMPIGHIKYDPGREYFKKGKRWGYLDDKGEFIDTPRE